MALPKATIQVSPYITVRGTEITPAMLDDNQQPAPGRTKVMVNGRMFDGVRLDAPAQARVA